MAALIGELIGLIAVVMLFGIPLSYSPLGKAWAERLRGQTIPNDLDRRVKELEAEVLQLREIVVLSEATRHPDAHLTDPVHQAAQLPPARELQ